MMSRVAYFSLCRPTWKPEPMGKKVDMIWRGKKEAEWTSMGETEFLAVAEARKAIF